MSHHDPHGRVLISASELARLRAELAEARLNDGRYRWLRDAESDDIGVVQGFGAVDIGSTGVADTYERVLCGAELDAAIDAARGEP